MLLDSLSAMIVVPKAAFQVALPILGALLFLPRGIFPEHLSTATVAIAATLGRRGMLFGLLGAMACMSGAAVETMLSGASSASSLTGPGGKTHPLSLYLRSRNPGLACWLSRSSSSWAVSALRNS